MYQPRLRKRSDANGFNFGLLRKEKPVYIADALGLMFLFGMFVLAMLTYIERKK